MKIGIYLNDKGMNNMDLRFPDKGNPGIGGTEYCLLMLGYALGQYIPQVEVIYLHYNSNLLPVNCTELIVSSEEECIAVTKEHKIDLLVHISGRSDEWYQMLEENQISAILWAHCFLTAPELRLVTKCKAVKRVVFVGKEQYDTYLDHDIINKSTYIYNMLFMQKEKYNRNADFHPWVTYVGSLTWGKGFDIMAKSWPYIVKKVPEAELHVLGSGKLYDKNSRLGKYQLAEASFENTFMPYLTDEKGNILPSVIFHGLVGEGKEQIFNDTAVGVINPSAITETFGISGVEMEACGVPVATKGKYGLLDTVIHKKTGLLSKSDRQFARNVITLLKDRELNKELGWEAQKFVQEAFEPEKLANQWLEVFVQALEETECIFQKPQGHYTNDMKWVRIVLRFIRFKLGLKRCPSLIEWKFMIKKILKGHE